jgi:hypothetical protein
VTRTWQSISPKSATDSMPGPECRRSACDLVLQQKTTAAAVKVLHE